MTRHSARTRGPRTLATVFRGGTALVTLAVLVVGLPVALYKLGGDPLPQHVPAWSHITTLLLHRDNGTVFLGAVRDISWIAWAAFTVAVVTEAQAALRGRRAPRLRLGGLQNSAGWLVALIVLAFGSQPAAVLASAAPSVVTVSAVRPAPPAAHPAGLPADYRTEASTADPAAPQVMSMGFSQMVTIRSGDCLWSIAQRYLGNGDLFPEIVKLNFGHDMGGGQKFTDPSVIWPGWVLQLPASPAGAVVGRLARNGRADGGRHAGHHSRDPRFSHPHPAATAHASDRPAPLPRRRPTRPRLRRRARARRIACGRARGRVLAPGNELRAPGRTDRDLAVRRVRRGSAGRRRERCARPDAPPPAPGPPLRQADPGAGQRSGNRCRAAAARRRAVVRQTARTGSAIRRAGTGAAVQPGHRAAVPRRGHAVRP